MVAHRVTIRPLADEDIDRHFEYLNIESSLTTACAYLDALETTLNDIAQNPHIGSMKTMSKDLLSGVRMWPVKRFKRFLVFYINREESIDVIRIIHASQDYLRQL